MVMADREKRQQQLNQQHKQAHEGHEIPGNLWESMLRDAMRRNRLPDGTIVFAGPEGCGKSSLLDAFLEGSAFLANPSGAAATAAAAAAAVTPAGDTGPEGGAGSVATSGTDAGQQAAKARGFHPVLAYSYLDATDPAEQGSERDDSPPRVSVWCCSEMEFEGLLEMVLRPSALANTVIVVGVDLSRPWEVMEAVKKWADILEKHITKLMKHISVGAQDDLRAAVRTRLAGLHSGSGTHEGQGENSGRAYQEDGGSHAELGEGVLEKNLGVPMVVVGCKADSLQSETFEQQQRLHFIQQSLRRFCLKYGAALVYTSAKDGVNCGVLHRYLLSCLYPEAFPCREGGQTTDAAFIPAGWDSKRLIDGLLSADKTPWGPNAEFADVVVAPPSAGKGLGSADGGGVGGRNVMGSLWDGNDPSLSSEEPDEVVESEEAWLSSLGKQVPAGESRQRWQLAMNAVSSTKKTVKTKSPRPGPGNVPDPRSFFANLLASGSSTVSPPKGGPRKKT